MVLRSIFYLNVVKCPSKNRQQINSKEWKQAVQEGIPFLTREIEIVSPQIILGLGRDVEDVLQRYLGPLEHVKGNSSSLPKHCEDLRTGRQFIFLYHTARGWFFRKEHQQRAGKIANDIKLFYIMKNFIARGYYIY
jgi:uracil-DNA glycosylase